MRYGVGDSTISDIKKNKEKTHHFKRRMSDMGMTKKAKVLRGVRRVFQRGVTLIYVSLRGNFHIYIYIIVKFISICYYHN